MQEERLQPEPMFRVIIDVNYTRPQWGALADQVHNDVTCFSGLINLCSTPSEAWIPAGISPDVVAGIEMTVYPQESTENLLQYDREPGAYDGVICSTCGQQGLTFEVYMKQVRDNTSEFKCPRCGKVAPYDWKRATDLTPPYKPPYDPMEGDA